MPVWAAAWSRSPTMAGPRRSMPQLCGASSLHNQMQSAQAPWRLSLAMEVPAGRCSRPWSAPTSLPTGLPRGGLVTLSAVPLGRIGLSLRPRPLRSWPACASWTCRSLRRQLARWVVRLCTLAWCIFGILSAPSWTVVSAYMRCTALVRPWWMVSTVSCAWATWAWCSACVTGLVALVHDCFVACSDISNCFPLVRHAEAGGPTVLCCEQKEQASTSVKDKDSQLDELQEKIREVEEEIKQLQADKLEGWQLDVRQLRDMKEQLLEKKLLLIMMRNSGGI